MTMNPGSYNEFLAREGLLAGPDAILAHSVALDGFKVVLAQAKGVSLEDLHTMPMDYSLEQETAA